MKGLDQFSDVLDLVRNADKYNEKVQELKKLYDTIKESSAQLGDLRIAAAIKETAQNLLDNTKKEIEAMKEKYLKEVEVSKQNLAKEFEKAEQAAAAAKKVADEAREQKKALEIKEKELEKLSAELSGKERNLTAQESALSIAQAEVAERLEKLRTVMNG